MAFVCAMAAVDHEPAAAESLALVDVAAHCEQSRAKQMKKTPNERFMAKSTR